MNTAKAVKDGDDWKARFQFVVTLFVILLCYVVTDKLKFTPDQIKNSEAEVREELLFEQQRLNEELRSIKKQMEMRIAAAEQSKNFEQQQKNEKLQFRVNALETTCHE